MTTPRYTARLSEKQDVLGRHYTWYVTDHKLGEQFYYRCAKSLFWGAWCDDFESLGY